MSFQRIRSFAVVFALMLFAGAGDLNAQSSTGANSAPLAFEVSSVKPNKSGPNSPQRAGLSRGERVTMINVPLLVLLQNAYPGMSAIEGAPKWVGSPGGPNFDADRFDVNAKANAESSVDQLRIMLQTLLADRFKLAVHVEPRPTDVYAIRLARADGKLGPNLHPASTDCRALIAAAAADKAPTPGKHPCGTVTTNFPPWQMRGVLITQLTVLRIELGRPIVDRTGLSGSFDLDLNWTPRWAFEQSFDRNRFPNIDPAGPDIFTAVQEQLGLKLVSEKDDQSVLVVDHVEPPTPD